MKYLLFLLVGVTLFFALSDHHLTPEIVGQHDKFAHFIVFFILSYLMNLSFPDKSLKHIMFVMVIFSIGIEVFQHFFTLRQMSTADLGAGFMGIILFFITHKMIAKKGVRNHIH